VPKLRLSEAARDDLRDVRTYSKAVWGVRLTRDYIDGFRQSFARLRANAGTGIAEPDLGDDMRSLGYRSHRIYYRVASSSDTIEIVRVLHHAQSTEGRLGPQ